MEYFLHLHDKLRYIRTPLLSIPAEVFSSLCREEANIATHVSTSHSKVVSCKQTKTTKGVKETRNLILYLLASLSAVRRLTCS